jgi:hypothetical protein
MEKVQVLDALDGRLTTPALADGFASVEGWNYPVARMVVSRATLEAYGEVLREAKAWGAALEVSPDVPDGEVHLRVDGSPRGGDATFTVIRFA